MNDYKFITIELRRNLSVFEELFTNQAKEFYAWKSHPDKWSLLEILCHLRDEEVEDFRTRTQYALEQRTEIFPSINPEGWAKEREYIKKDYNQVLQDFIKERKASLEWLGSLDNPNWNNQGTHMEYGKISAGFFLKNWLAHDYLHIRQILALQYAYLTVNSKEKLIYAGAW